MQAPIKDNKDLCCHLVIKHSWKGKYKRIFSIGTRGITTYNPSTLEVTNAWPYSDVISMLPVTKSPTNNEFVLTMRKANRKSDQMRFSSEFRSEILTESLRFRDFFDPSESKSAARYFNAFKFTWNETKQRIVLGVNECGISQCETALGGRQPLRTYDYKEIVQLILISDIPNGIAIAYGGFSRLHAFSVDERDEFVRTVAANAATYQALAVRTRREPCTFEDFQINRFGTFSSDEALTSFSEFTVHKTTPRGEQRRVLCLTEQCLVERDPATYNIVSLRPLSDVFALVRVDGDPQRFAIEFVRGAPREYSSTERDALLATLLDGVRASGNRDVCVRMRPTQRGHRVGVLFVPVDEDVESQCVRWLCTSQRGGLRLEEALDRFNANVSYSGLLHAVTQDSFFAENKEKLINVALSSVIQDPLVTSLMNEADASVVSNEQVEKLLHALHRLAASKAGFQAFTQIVGFRERLGLFVVRALARQDEALSYAAIDTLNALMQPLHDECDLGQEQLNKSSLLSSKKFLESLLEMFKAQIVRGTGALVISAMLDFLTFALCTPYSETTLGSDFDDLLELVALNGRVLYKLFQHPSNAIVKGVGLVMKAIIEEADAETSSRMQTLALSEGALLRHLHTFLFTQSHDARQLTNKQLSRHLVGLWTADNGPALSVLRNMVPLGLYAYLEKPDAPPPDDDVDRINVRDNLKMATDREKRQPGFGKSVSVQLRLVEKRLDKVLEHWRARVGVRDRRARSDDARQVVLRKPRQRLKATLNWQLFAYHFQRDHAKTNLIWNYKTREELREAIENELRLFNSGKDLNGKIPTAWNYLEFEVHYPSLNEEIKIGDYYLRLLLEEDGREETGGEVGEIMRSYEFFNDLYHRFLLSAKPAMKMMCLHAMSIVYGRYFEEIGPFNDTKYIVAMLDRTCDRGERDRLLQLLGRVVLHRSNVKDFVEAGGIRQLIDVLTLAHLHISRAYVPTQTNAIEAGNASRDAEKEWYYGNSSKERLGPFSFDEMKSFYNGSNSESEHETGRIDARTRCWAFGMDGWKPLAQVPQLKWCLMASGQALMNESELAHTALNILIRLCSYAPSRDADGAIIRPLPRVKRVLSEANNLSHVVQLLLTFDPVLVEKVAVLLNHVVVDNPCVSQLYLSGVFYFLLMYTGSNVLPIASFLKYTHMRQAFRSEIENPSSELQSASVLSHLLPEAMICYLENYSTEKFAQVFLGEFDSPEVIWNGEMRRSMIEAIAKHLADFSPRLLCNVRALYQYCQIPVIQYAQLEHELFINIYYLRHFCDTKRFPEWPVRDPIGFLKDLLEGWKKEVEKKPPTMSLDDALQELNLTDAGARRRDGAGADGDVYDDSVIRKAYFRLAQKYHPDKNPDGREMFDRVNKAYEFLCTRAKMSNGPDEHNLALLLRSQSILFSRFRDLLSPYKYAGYPMLIRTLQLETRDPSLFKKAVPLLHPAAELCYHTMQCSALNAEELRREGGLECLQEAFDRCVSVLTVTSRIDELPAQVCLHVVNCYRVAARFEACRLKMVEQPRIIGDLCRLLALKNLPELCAAVAECCVALCSDVLLQTNLFKAGLHFALLGYLFSYDFTLEESGIEKTAGTHQQETVNVLSRWSLRACAALGGYVHGTAELPEVRRAFQALLTPFVARRLTECDGEGQSDTASDARVHDLLKLLNSNTENPNLIWNNATRAELTDYITTQQTALLRDGSCDADYGADFRFSAHRDELVIGEIFVRLYNEQKHFVLEHPRKFAADLLEYISSAVQKCYSQTALQRSASGSDDTSAVVATQPLSPAVLSDSGSVKRLEMALEALLTLIRAFPGSEMQCIGKFKLLFALFQMAESHETVLQHSLGIVHAVITNQDCVADIAQAGVLQYLLMLVETYPAGHEKLLDVLHALVSSTKIIKELVVKGAVVYILDLYANGSNATERVRAAELFAKTFADKLVGPKVKLLLAKFLPAAFLDAMRDAPETSVHLYETVHENPELIWNDESRNRVSSAIRTMKQQHYATQRTNPDARWSIAEEFTLVDSLVREELVVGGVYVRLFIQNAAWVLRKPREFLVDLFEAWSRMALGGDAFKGEQFEQLGTALVLLLQVHTNLLDALPQIGYIPKVFQAMTRTQDDAVPRSALLVCDQFSKNDFCVRAIASVPDAISSMQIAMRTRRDCVHAAANALASMMECGDEDLYGQAVRSELVPFLLTLLESPAAIQSENLAATRALIVNAVKALQTRTMRYADDLNAILERSSTWKDYRDQRHDLFLTGPAVAGYLTSSTPQVAGYLMSGSSSGSSKTVSRAPPPDPFLQ